MRKLALNDEILMTIDKPARYIGNELNSVMKDTSQIDIRYAMCFPDVYEIGMSHLGIQILYDMFNRREDTWCERVYSPWQDMDKIMREKDIPFTRVFPTGEYTFRSSISQSSRICSGSPTSPFSRLLKA